MPEAEAMRKDKDRVILHCDCNSFFASVETALNPEYAGVPMAVCGSTEDRHGIVLAKNELAKGYGIVTAETVYSARKKCPSLVIASPHYKAYSDYSRRVNAIYKEYTDLVEPFGIDESWLDVTASERAFGTGEKIAEEIRERIKREIGITVSIGVSFNKVFAKLGSDYKKPDAITVIKRENYEDIVYPLHPSEMLFVGKRTAEELTSMGIRTIGELASFSENILVRRFGKMGSMLIRYARGEDDSAVMPADCENDQKSIGRGCTFKRDLVGREVCRVGIDCLSEEIGTELRKNGRKCMSVAISVKDEYLKVTSRQRHLNKATDISREIADVAFSILCDGFCADKPIRTITVTVSSLVSSDSAEQLDIFSAVEDVDRSKSRKREETIDIIRQKYGTTAILRGSVMNNDIGVIDFEDKSKKQKD